MLVKYDVYLLVKVFFVTFLSLGCQSQEVGSSCTVRSTGESGICKISRECPEVEEQAKRGISPTICGFYQLIVPIVCCESKIDSFTSANDVSTEGAGDSILFPDDTPKSQQNSFISSGRGRLSEQKCLEYTKSVTDVVHAIPLVTNVEPFAINVTKCEYNSVALIVGGSPAALGEFPFMAAIGFPDSDDQPNWRCGGTLISDRWVLTAAHCTFSRDGGEPRWVRLGDLDLSRFDETQHVDYDIDQIRVHPRYEYPQKYNDIALLSTRHPVRFSKYIRPACLNTKSKIQQRVAVATGWGQTDYSEPNSDILLKVPLNIYDNRECARAYKNEIDSKQIANGITKTMLCVGALAGGRDTCQGDSGGPLVVTEADNMCKFYVIGITSFGKLCAQVNTPAIYTKVSEYIDWIENIIWQ